MAGKRLQTASGRLSISVSNFGPIAKAEVDLRPLTVFVGPSNTGKSWLLILLYALHRFAGKGIGVYDEAGEQFVEELRREIRGAASGGESPESLARKMGEFLGRKEQIDFLRKSLVKQTERLAEEMCRCYGLSDPSDLMNRETANGKSSICVRDGSSTLLDMALKREIATKPLSLAVLRKKVAALPVQGRIEELIGMGSFLSPRAMVSEVLQALHLQIYGILQNRAWYLPADRTGIMHAQDVVIGALIARAPLEGIRRSPQTPLLSGVLADFLEELVSFRERPRYMLRQRHRNPSRRQPELAELIEQRIIDGKISIHHSEVTRQPKLAYQPQTWDKGRVSLTNASSMVSELAPLVLFLRHSVGRGDTLIVEEPESHLHPAKQAELVEVIAAVVNSGIRVVLTTHSDWILEKLANLVLSSQQPAGAVQSKLALDKDSVGVWLFQNKRGKSNQSVVKEIPLEDGLYESGYREVSHQLYDDWVPLVENRQNSGGGKNK